VSDPDHARCVFCAIDAARIIAANGVAFAIRDISPATPSHTRVLPKRHAPTFFDLTEGEGQAIERLSREPRHDILATGSTVEGFTIGINIGEVAGKTIFHCRYHLTPRRRGDVPNPRGGVRAVIPGKADY
jgi:diadenosine tetraphosphate (Ap4A) HIT family hydrolase